MTTAYPLGARVHVEFDGTIMEPFYSTDQNFGLFTGNIGWVDIKADNGATHVMWLNNPSGGKGITVTPPKPTYVAGKAYQDTTGRVYVRLETDGDPHLPAWLAPTGIRVSENRPYKPMTKLVPETEAA